MEKTRIYILLKAPTEKRVRLGKTGKGTQRNGSIREYSEHAYPITKTLVRPYGGGGEMC